MSYLIALTLLLTPAFAVRFSLGHLPTDILMVWVVLLWIIFFANLFLQKKLTDFFKFVSGLDKKILLCIGLFFLAGLISTFVKGIDQKKLGEFIVLFLQPISVFFIAAYIFRTESVKCQLLIVNCCYLLLAAAGLYAAIQYQTLWGLPPAWWGNSVEPKRALSFFGHPDFYGLFSAPLLALLIPDALSRLKIIVSRNLVQKIFWINLLYVVAFILGVLGLVLSQSRAGWVGLLAALIIYAFFAADKKTKLLTIGLMVLAILFISFTNFRYRILVPLLTHDKSTSSRITLWQSGWKGIEESPILGLGLTGYSNQYKNLITDPTLDAHNFPHNIFLDTWVETGIIGLIGLIGLIILVLYRGMCSIPLLSKGGLGEVNWIPLSVSLFLICLLVQGQFDNPYFMNDLAMVFWIILALAI